MTIDSLLGELSLLQVIKTREKSFRSIEIVKGNGREMWVTLQREVGLRLKLYWYGPKSDDCFAVVFKRDNNN